MNREEFPSNKQSPKAIYYGNVFTYVTTFK